MRKFFDIRNAEARPAWALIVAAVALAAFCGVYATRHFAIQTDVTRLFPRNVPWTERDRKFLDTFPQHEMLVVVDAPTPEHAQRASDELPRAALNHGDHVRAVEKLQGSTFFRENSLLFLPVDRLERTTGGLQRAAPMLGALSADPSLSGILRVFSGNLAGVARGQYTLDSMVRPMSAASDTIDDVL